MSTPNSPQMDERQSRRKSLQRFMSKLVKKPGSKRDSVGSPSSPSSEAPSPALIDTQSKGKVEADPKAKAPAVTSSNKPQSPAERARLIALKHDVELADDWPFQNKVPGERVEKPIRMRVHRFCHRCETAFGGEKICPSCDHKRCKQCPRTPAKKDKKSKHKKDKKDIYAGLTLPNKNGGEPLVHKNIRHRVHWKCHRCENNFGSDTVCKTCQHSRCKRCERDLPKKKSEEGEKKRRPVKWTCHECQNAYTGVKTCANCGHNRCKTCPRESSRAAREKEAQSKPMTEQIGDALKAITLS